MSARFTSHLGGLRLLVVLIAARALVHFALYADGIALLEIAGMDIAALVIALLAFSLGPRFNTFYGSKTLFFVVVLGAIAGAGSIAEMVRNRHLSNMMGFIGVLGAGSGLCLAKKGWNEAIWACGAVVVIGGALGLAHIQQPLDALVIASPYLLGSALYVLSPALRGAR